MTSPVATQVCSACGAELPLDAFYVERRSKTGFRKNCKVCQRAAVKAYQRSPAGRALRRDYECSPAGRERKKRYRSSPHGRAKEREDLRKRLQEDPSFKIAYLVRIGLLNALKRETPPQHGRVIERLGCSIEFLQLYLEMQFQPGMKWANRGVLWHIDHRRPLAAFDLEDPVQLSQACHFTNLQPLLARDNLSKGVRV